MAETQTRTLTDFLLDRRRAKAVQAARLRRIRADLAYFRGGKRRWDEQVADLDRRIERQSSAIRTLLATSRRADVRAD